MVLKDTNIGRLILESVMGEATEKKASKNLDTAEIRKVANGLVKISSLPYKEDVYQSVQELVKTAATYLDDAANELEFALSRQAELEKAMEMRTLLDDMINYGLVDPDEVRDKVAELSGKSRQEIEVVKTAVEMIKNNKEGSSLFDLSKSGEVKTAKKRGMFDGII